MSSLLKYTFLFITLSLLVGPAVAQTNVATISQNDLTIRLDEKLADSFSLTIELPPAKSISKDKVKAFTLNQPTRLGIDLVGFPTLSSAHQAVTHRIVSGVRFGGHPDKTRIVVDLLASERPSFDVAVEGRIISINFSFNKALEVSTTTTKKSLSTLSPLITAPNPVQPVITQELTSTSRVTTTTAQRKPPSTAAPLITAPSITVAVTQAPLTTKPQVTTTSVLMTTTTVATTTTTSTVKSSIDEQTVTAAPVISGIKFAKTDKDGAPAVSIRVSNLNPYVLSERKMNFYELFIPSATLEGKHLALPQFPPKGFEGFELFVATPKPEGVLIKIYAIGGYSLYPFRTQEGLWIKAVKDVAG